MALIAGPVALSCSARNLDHVRLVLLSVGLLAILMVSGLGTALSIGATAAWTNASYAGVTVAAWPLWLFVARGCASLLAQLSTTVTAPNRATTTIRF